MPVMDTEPVAELEKEVDAVAVGLMLPLSDTLAVADEDGVVDSE